MDESKITDTEKIGKDILEANRDYVLRTTPLAIETFEERHPELCDLVSRKVAEEGIDDLGNVFRPGVPDFLGFDEDGDYVFVEVKGEGDGLRHSQLKWFRDFEGIKAEIWFTDSNDGITEKMKSENLNMYSLKKPDSENNGDLEIQEGKDGFLNVQIPKTLAAVMNIEPGDRVNWRVKDRSILELETD